MPKGTSREEATSNSEKIEPVALAVIELCLEGIRQSVENSVVESVSGRFESLFGLSFTLPILPPHHQNEAGFWMMLFCGPHLLLCGPCYTLLSYRMIIAIQQFRV